MFCVTTPYCGDLTSIGLLGIQPRALQIVRHSGGATPKLRLEDDPIFCPSEVDVSTDPSLASVTGTRSGTRYSVYAKHPRQFAVHSARVLTYLVPGIDSANKSSRRNVACRWSLGIQCQRTRGCRNGGP